MSKQRGRLGLIILLLLTGLACQNGDFNPVGTSFPSEATVEASLFNLVNQERRKHGAPELTLDANISQVARQHSTDMRDRNYFSHTSPDGKNFDDRLRNAGITFRLSGENLGRTTNMADPADYTHNSFLGDSIHRTILLNKQFTRIGIGVARSGNSYWITQDYVKP